MKYMYTEIFAAVKSETFDKLEKLDCGYVLDPPCVVKCVTIIWNTYPCNVYPLIPHIYSKTGVRRGIPIFFLFLL